ncbi:conserved protein of unknown function [Shewanella benthica]|uniref:Uncharacterized protein n=1 Tax=Shewanella benthica TaxID=43661 RepID=A0A330M7N3_9GAMM|nr:conserved protein of unknown function [Shewanella benthica]
MVVCSFAAKAASVGGSLGPMFAFGHMNTDARFYLFRAGFMLFGA